MESPKHSLIPSFIYSSSSSTRSFLLDKSPCQKNFLIASPTEPGKRIEMYSPAFYAACTFGGILSCGLTHMTVTPLDLVKCNMQAVKKIGLLGLFTRGLPLRILRIGTLTRVQWGIYDAFKVFVRLPTTGGVSPAAAITPKA